MSSMLQAVTDREFDWVVETSTARCWSNSGNQAAAIAEP